ncbi:hypothetical protein [Flaviaesturariibacter terrae]
MIEKFIFYVIVGVAVSASLHYLNKTSAKQPEPGDDGKYLLRMNKLYHYVGLVGIVIAFVFAVVPPIADEPDLTMLVLILLMLLLFGGLGVHSFLLYRNHFLQFDDQVIRVRNPRGAARSVDWDSLQRATFQPFSGYLVLTTTDGSKLKIHQHLVGVQRFVTLLQAKKGWTAGEMRLPPNLVK